MAHLARHAHYRARWRSPILLIVAMAGLLALLALAADAQDTDRADAADSTRAGAGAADPGSVSAPDAADGDDAERQPLPPPTRRESPLITRLRDATPIADQLEASWTVVSGDLHELRDRIQQERELTLDAITTWSRRAPGNLLEASANALVFETADGFVTWHLDSRQTGSARPEALAALGLRIPRPAITSVSGRRLTAMRPMEDDESRPVAGNPDVLWTHELPAPITGVQLAPGLVIARTAAGGAGQVFVLHAASGRVLGRLELADPEARVVPVRGGLLVVDADTVRRLDLIRLEGVQLMREQWQEQLVSGGGEADERDLVLRLVNARADWERNQLIDRILSTPGDRMDVYLVDEMQVHLDAFELDATHLRLVRLLDDVLARRGKRVGHASIRAALARELRSVGLLDTPHAPFDPAAVTADQMERLHALAALIAQRSSVDDMELMLELLEFPLDRFQVAPFQSIVLAYIEPMTREDARPAFNKLLLLHRNTKPFERYTIEDLQLQLVTARVRALDLAVGIESDGQPAWIADDFTVMDRLFGSLDKAQHDLETVQQRARGEGLASAARLAVALRAARSRVDRLLETVSSLGSALTILQSARHALLHSDDDRLQEPIRKVLDENWEWHYGRLLDAALNLELIEGDDAGRMLSQVVEFRHRIERLEVKGVVDSLR